MIMYLCTQPHWGELKSQGPVFFSTHTPPFRPYIHDIRTSSRPSYFDLKLPEIIQPIVENEYLPIFFWKGAESDLESLEAQLASPTPERKKRMNQMYVLRTHIGLKYKPQRDGTVLQVGT